MTLSLCHPRALYVRNALTGHNVSLGPNVLGSLAQVDDPAPLAFAPYDHGLLRVGRGSIKEKGKVRGLATSVLARHRRVLIRHGADTGPLDVTRRGVAAFLGIRLRHKALTVRKGQGTVGRRRHGRSQAHNQKSGWHQFHTPSVTRNHLATQIARSSNHG